MLLAADIGATNARFAIVERPASPRLVFERTYPTASFPDFEPALEAFLREAGAKPARGAIAIAGPINDDAGRLTNRTAWTVNRRAVQEDLGIEIRLLNDFQALAYGVAAAGAEDWRELQAGAPEQHGAIAVVGAGTGLGVAALAWDGRRYRAQASEGGHIGFAPNSELQIELLRHLFARHGRVSAERVLSGSGLVAVYEFLRLRAADGEVLNDAAVISARAFAEPAGLAATALDLFVRCYGQFAGDIALALLPRGGLYVSGGIAAKLALRFAAGDFIAAFNDKGRHQRLTASIPVRVITNEKLGLIGAARAAA